MRKDPFNGTSAYVLETGAEAWDRVTEKRGRGRPSLKPARDAAKADQQVRELAEPVTVRTDGLAGIRADTLDQGRGTMAPPSGFYGLGASTPQQQAKYNRRATKDRRPR